MGQEASIRALHGMKVLRFGRGGGHPGLQAGLGQGGWPSPCELEGGGQYRRSPPAPMASANQSGALVAFQKGG